MHIYTCEQAKIEYDKLIEANRSTPKTKGQTEQHHIVPKAHGGNNDPTNLIHLFYKDHLKAHYFLWLIYRDKPMTIALHGMFFRKLKMKNIIPEELEKYANIYQTIKEENIKNQQGTINAINENGLWENVTIEEYKKRNLKCNNTGKVPMIDEKGICKLVPKDHPNIKNGLWKHHAKGTISVRNNITGETSHVTKEEYKNNSELVGVNKGKINGNNNPNAKHITIYNSEGTIMYKCSGNFKKTCVENNLPFKMLEGSYSNNGSPIFINLPNRKRKIREKDKTNPFAGWYAKIDS